MRDLNPRKHAQNVPSYSLDESRVEAGGFEPPTPALQTQCSPAELCPHCVTIRVGKAEYVLKTNLPVVAPPLGYLPVVGP